MRETLPFATHELLIAGRWREAGSGQRLPLLNPSDGSTLAEIARGSAEDVDAAVQAAQAARAGEWGRLTAAERGRLLMAMGRAVLERVDELARLEALDVGKPLKQGRADAVALARYLEFYGGAADKVSGETIPYLNGYTALTWREPHGVTGHVVPWNYPMQIIGRSVGAALAMGNACVLKPAEEACLTALAIGRIAQQCGLPAGALNIVPGLGEEAGAALTAHAGVQHLSFTGSVATGRLVQAAAAKHTVPVTLELGGKSPNVVLPDADLDRVVPGILQGMRFTRQGQSCSAGTRLLLHESIHDEVVARVVKELAKMRVGDPMDEASEVGAIISAEQYERVNHYVEMARATPGARIACGGGRPAGEAVAKGYFYAPTLIEGVPHASPVCQDEIFGPVAVTVRWRDFDEAIALANDTRFGLAASVWTRDLAKALAFVDRVKAGFVQVNQYITPQPNLPYGGLKMSGLGKENTLEAMLEHFTCSKTVLINPGA